MLFICQYTFLIWNLSDAVCRYWGWDGCRGRLLPLLAMLEWPLQFASTLNREAFPLLSCQSQADLTAAVHLLVSSQYLSAACVSHEGAAVKYWKGSRSIKLFTNRTLSSPHKTILTCSFLWSLLLLNVQWERKLKINLYFHLRRKP